MTPELGEHSSSSKLQSLPAPPQNVAARRQQLELELAPVPRGGSPCLSLEQLFNTEDLPSTYEPLSHTHLDEGPTDQTVKTLFGDLSAERQSRLDGWNASEHSLASR